jgi:hypothetical protein
MTDTTAVYAEIVKHERDANGDLVVFGRATGPDLDLDRQICDQDWLKEAMPTWFQTGANLREQHSSIAAGVGTEITQKPDGGWDLKALVVDTNSARKVERGVLKGYSIGIRNPRVVKDAAAPGGRIVAGTVVEVSLVDRPANPTCSLTLAKALKPGPLAVTPGTVDFERSLVKVEELHEDAVVNARFDEDIEKRDFSAGERREAASEGQAQSDGSFPIKNASDLKNAIRLAGNAKDPAKAKAHIKRRAAALGLSDKIPDSWKAADALDLLKGYDLVAVRKGDQSGDIANAEKAIAIIAGLIQAEAVQLADGTPSEACDIYLLLDAVKALEFFICRERKEPAMAHVELSDESDVEKAAGPDVSGDDLEKKDKPAFLADKDEDADDEETDADGEKKPAAKKKPAASKSAEGESTNENDDITELVKALSAEVSELKGELTKAMSAPAPGGPVLTRTTEATSQAETRESHLSKAAHFKRLAYEVNDPQAKAGYLQMAADATAAAN